MATLCGKIGNVDNIGNFGNIGNLDNIGNLGNIGILDNFGKLGNTYCMRMITTIRTAPL